MGRRLELAVAAGPVLDQRMGLPAARLPFTYADYLAAEATSEIKHEFVEGEAFAMAGGTREHGLVQTGLLVALGAALKGRPCRPAASDNRVYIPSLGEGFYPDAHVVCGPFQADPADPEACINPSILFEVLSPSTEAWDRGGKFERYELLPTLREYVLLHADRERVERFRRNDDGTWNRAVFGPGESIELAGAAVHITMDDIYAVLRAEVEAGSAAP